MPTLIIFIYNDVFNSIQNLSLIFLEILCYLLYALCFLLARDNYDSVLTSSRFDQNGQCMAWKYNTQFVFDKTTFLDFSTLLAYYTSKHVIYRNNLIILLPSDQMQCIHVNSLAKDH